MKRGILRDVEKHVKAYKERNRWYRVVVCLACVVVFCTFYALILPAATMEKECTIPEHTHGEECYTVKTNSSVCNEETLHIHRHTHDCYDADDNIVCGYADFVVHTHDSSCYDEKGELWCTLPEIKVHKHTDHCYAQAKDNENKAHVHTDACYALEKGQLICKKSTEPEHKHTDECYTETTTLICTEDHEHSESCYKTERELTCGYTEEPAHQHDDTCYEQVKTLICNQSTESVEETDEKENEPELICKKTEIILHEHTAKCFDANGNLICGKIQVLEHQHDDTCFDKTEELICGMEEHQHSDACQEINLSEEEQAQVDEVIDLIDGLSTEEELDENIETGDFETVINRLSYMYKNKVELVTDYNGCAIMYDRMMKAYDACFENDILILTVEQIHQVDDLFNEIEDYMYDTFGFLHAQTSSGTASRSLVYTSSGIKRMRAAASASEDESGEIFVDKYVEQTSDSNYLLTLTAYVTGNTVTTKVEKPADVVLVLDQSASMHVPVGYPGSEFSYDQLYTEEPEGLIRFELKALKENSEMQVNAQHHGYYLAQSRVQTNGKYMLYVIQYVPGEDQPWKFYPITNTNFTTWNHGTPQPQSFVSLDAIGDNQFYFYKTQYGALYDSVSSFIERMHASGVAHRVAITGFAQPIYSHIYTDGTPYLYKSLNADIYAAALQNVSTKNGFESVINSLNAFKSDYPWTCTAAGLDMAEKVFENAPEVESDTPNVGRSKIVVLFTDGAANMTTDGEDHLNNLDVPQNQAVEMAAKLKSTYEATVYAIGTSAVEGLPYMSYLSSDYPNAKDLSNPGGQIENPVYTMTVKNANQLNIAFDSVNVSSSETVDLGADTVLRDVISDYFDLPSNITTEDINVFTADYLGNGAFAEKENWEPFSDAQISFVESMQDERKDTINVTNFDYADNYVDDTTPPRGKQLIVQVPIVVRDGFWGGNNVPTNETATAIYKDQVKIEPFPMPEANVPINPTIEVRDKTIYYGSQVTSKELVTEITAGGYLVNINDDGTLTPQADWMDDYATLTWTAGSTTAKNTIDNTKCAQYEYSVDQKPKYDGSANRSENPSNIVGTVVTVAGVTVSDTSQIHVLVPVLTYQDSEIHLGDTPDADYFEETNHVPGVTWVDIEDYATARQADEEQPTLHFSYQPRRDFLTSAVPVDVTVTRDIPDGKLDMTDVTRFLWNPCSIDLHDEALHDIESLHLGSTPHPEFWIHVRSGYELPDTGGAGTTPYTSGGLLLLSGASILLLYRCIKRRKEESTAS